MKYLLDTNICIYIIKQKPITVFEKFKSFDIGSVGICSITLAELQYGVMKSSNPEKNLDALNEFLTPLEIIDFDVYAALAYGKIRAELERQGTPIGPLDTLIAAQALSHKLILVTNNVKEFIRVKGLEIKNWV
jgi:tRNA(fMet)-specific endonuclease VapC